ncbi:DUF1281 family ferredoxin-like fold protein [Morganella morganii]|uniref:DUF1281 family ferredoxin-like fold protein n=1 Tax=Morganella morganii TaxID=582 RepID=UPI00375231E5
MPNHVTNVVEASPEVIKAMLNADGLVDFELIIPRHPDLTLPGMGIYTEAESAAKLMCKEMVPDHELMARMEMVSRLRASALEMTDEQFEQFVQMMRNKRNHGFYNSMEFARSGWGTKWNAYGQTTESHTETTVEFETAWSHPLPVITALSKRFPAEKIVVKYADEDTGSNCGRYTMQNGEFVEQDIAPSWRDQSDSDKRKWTEFAFKLRNPDTDPKEYGYNENWEYVEGED